MTERPSLGSRLRQVRIAAGMSQTDLSSKSGIPKPTLSRYENDHVAPSLGSLGRMADALGVARASLLEDGRHVEQHFLAALRRHGVRMTTTADADDLAGHVVQAWRRRARSAS
jgi:transcriptional regulator with XRE-family HTH domain